MHAKITSSSAVGSGGNRKGPLGPAGLVGPASAQRVRVLVVLVVPMVPIVLLVLVPSKGSDGFKKGSAKPRKFWPWSAKFPKRFEV